MARGTGTMRGELQSPVLCRGTAAELERGDKGASSSVEREPDPRLQGEVPSVAGTCTKSHLPRSPFPRCFLSPTATSTGGRWFPRWRGDPVPRSTCSGLLCHKP